VGDLLDRLEAAMEELDGAAARPARERADALLEQG